MFSVRPIVEKQAMERVTDTHKALERKGNSCSLKTQLKYFATPKWTLEFYQ